MIEIAFHIATVIWLYVFYVTLPTETVLDKLTKFMVIPVSIWHASTAFRQIAELVQL